MDLRREGPDEGEMPDGWLHTDAVATYSGDTIHCSAGARGRSGGGQSGDRGRMKEEEEEDGTDPTGRGRAII